MWIVATIATVLGLLAAGIVLFGGSGNDLSHKRSPFTQALVTLSHAQAIRYRAATATGSSEVTVTGHGEAIGTTTQDGQTFNFLSVGGKSYLKTSDGDLPGMPVNVAASRLKNTWALADQGALRDLLPSAPTPASLAGRLRTALTKATFPGQGNDTKLTIGGQSAARAATPIGDLYVTKAAPHRVLRYTPKRATGTGAPSKALPAFPALPPPGAGNAAAAALNASASSFAAIPADDTTGPDGGETDIDPVSPQDADAVYQSMESDARQLDHAVNPDVTFTIDGKPTLSCSDAGCAVQQEVTSSFTTGDGEKITGGDVYATMTATVTVQGKGAGGCSSTTSFPATSGGELSCNDGAAGPVVAEELAKAKAQAEEESRAEGGVEVPYEVDCLAEVGVEATAHVDVSQVENGLANDRTAADKANTKAQKPDYYRNHLRTPSGSDGGPGTWKPINRNPPGKIGEAWQRYQEQVTGVNRGSEYYVTPPGGGKPVEFDGYDPGPGFQEAKLGYASAVKVDGSLTAYWRTQWSQQATSQLDAANGTPVTWYFSRDEVAKAAEEMFKDKGLDIVVEWKKQVW